MIPSLCGILRDFKPARYGLRCFIRVLYIVLFENQEGIGILKAFLLWINSGVVYNP